MQNGSACGSMVLFYLFFTLPEAIFSSGQETT
jgi:hypothetical protein